jgi:hypothetical protein
MIEDFRMIKVWQIVICYLKILDECVEQITVNDQIYCIFIFPDT